MPYEPDVDAAEDAQDGRQEVDADVATAAPQGDGVAGTTQESAEHRQPAFSASSRTSRTHGRS